MIHHVQILKDPSGRRIHLVTRTNPLNRGVSSSFTCDAEDVPEGAFTLPLVQISAKEHDRLKADLPGERASWVTVNPQWERGTP